MRPTRIAPCCAGLFAALLLGAGCAAPADDALLMQSNWAVHTVCGGGTTVTGIDVSKWQGTVSWPKVKQDGRVFAIARVSDGLNNLDGQFAANWSGMKAAGVIRGAYQYFRPNLGAKAQADLFVDTIEAAGGLKSDDLPPVLDMETDSGLSPSAVRSAVDAWIARVEQRTNRRPIIYTGSYFWDGSVVTAKYAAYPLWTAHYTTKACPLVPDAWSTWTFWQYTDKDSVAGVSGGVDGDRFDGTLADLKALVAASVINQPDAGPPPDSAPPPAPDMGPPAADSALPDLYSPPPPLDGGHSPWPFTDGGATAPTLVGNAGCSLTAQRPRGDAGLLLLTLLLFIVIRQSGRRA